MCAALARNISRGCRRRREAGTRHNGTLGWRAHGKAQRARLKIQPLRERDVERDVEQDVSWRRGVATTAAMEIGTAMTIKSLTVSRVCCAPASE
jgi:hypothetical protein